MSKRTRKKIPTELMTATVSHLNHEGRGVAHVNGKTTFIFGALPNETVEFKYTHCHSKYDEAAVTTVLEKSVDRTTPRCQHFGVCGGCSLQHLNAESQRAHKQSVLLEHFKHQANCVPAEILPPLFTHSNFGLMPKDEIRGKCERATGVDTLVNEDCERVFNEVDRFSRESSYGYRRRARMSVRYVFKKEAVLVGFRERNASYVADIKQCETLHPSVGYKITALRELLMQLEIKSDIPQLEVTIGDTITAIIIRHMIELPNADREKLIAFAKENQLHFYLQPKGPETIHPLYPENPEALFYTIPADSLRLEFLPAQFTQINHDVNLQMIARAAELLELKKTDRVLDLFCGIGNFTLSIAKRAEKVIGVEGSDAAIMQAKKNAALNHINNTEFHTHNLAADLNTAEWAKKQYDKIVLDPPRAGASEILPYISSWKPSRIVYISCNPITLARDTETLLQLGYRLEKAGVMDMFPHTEHIEAIALFVRENHGATITTSTTLDRTS